MFCSEVWYKIVKNIFCESCIYSIVIELFFWQNTFYMCKLLNHNLTKNTERSENCVSLSWKCMCLNL